MASLKTLLASAVVVDEDGTPAQALALLRPHAEKLGAGPDGFAWYDPAKHDRYGVRAFVKQIAIGLSSQKIGTFLVGKELVVGFVPWADKLKIKAEAKAAKAKVVAIGPTKPAKVRRAKAAKPGLLRLHIPHDTVRDYIGFDEGPPMRSDDYTTGEMDLSSWPPTFRPLLSMLSFSIARAADGRVVSAGVLVPKPATQAKRPHTLRLRDGKTERVLDDLVPDKLSLDFQQTEAVGFVGDDIILLPSEPAYRGGTVKRPLVLRPKTKLFVELDELPAVKVAKYTKKDFPSFAVHGFARTGNGEDVLLWGDGGYTGGRTYKRSYDLGKLEPHEIRSAPGTGDSFFISNTGKVYEIRSGARPVQRLSKVQGIYGIAAGPMGVVLAAIIRSQPKMPIVVAWWPDAREWAPIKGEMFGFTGKTWFSERHVGYHPTSNLVWGYDVITHDLRAIKWDDVAALKRLPE